MFHTGAQNYTHSGLPRQGSMLNEIHGQYENLIQASNFHVPINHGLLIKTSSLREIFRMYAVYNVMCVHALWRKPNPRHCSACKDCIYQIGEGGGRVHMWEEAKDGVQTTEESESRVCWKIQTEGGPEAGLYHLGRRLIRAGVLLLQSTTMKVREMEAGGGTRQRPSKTWRSRSKPELQQGW